MKEKLFINYITNIHKIEPIFQSFIKKIPNNEKYKYYSNLKNQIVFKIPENIIKKNINIIIQANYLINKYLNNNLKKNNKKNNWNICLTKNNFMFNNPFTLDEIIFIPFNYILQNNEKILLETFIHEKLHIYQRYNLKQWNKIITNYTNWKLCKYEKQKNIIYNPDVNYNQYYYCYTFNGNEYKGHLNDDFETIWFHNNLKYENENLPKQEHPFEEYAYKLSKELSSL